MLSSAAIAPPARSWRVSLASLKVTLAGSAEEIREWMSGNLCRCGAYDHIVAAIQDAAQTTGSVRGG
jgi:aerobic-type carbon monoxide dehydrogenase small subunit (CoxS/CutS family)